MKRIRSSISSVRKLSRGAERSPAIFTDNLWALGDAETGGTAALTINALPSGNGTTITNMQYQVGAGTWVSLGTAATGVYFISGFTNGVLTPVSIRAVNLFGAGPASVAKSVTVSNAATAPAAFTDGQWTLTDTPSPGGDTLTVTISALPDDGGSPITALQYRIDGGTAIAMTGTGIGAKQITVTAETEVDIQIRAVNGVDPDPNNWSDTKTETPTVSPAPTLTGLAYDSGTEIASGDVDQAGTMWWFISNSATPLADGAAVKALVQGGTPTLEGSFAISAGTVNEVIDTSSLANGTWYLHAAPENSLGVLADEDDVVSFSISSVSGWNLAGASYMSKSFSVSAQETNPQGIYLSPDGTRLYVTGGTDDDLDQYSLSTAWDISTASHVRTRTISDDTQMTGVFFKNDGTRCYMVGNSNNSIYEYTLSSAWDISTTTLNHTLSITTQESTPQDVWFRDDGLKMYTIGSGGDTIDEWDLGTAWTLSTATYSREKAVSAQDILPHGVHLKDDGTVAYMVGGTPSCRVYEYTLSTAWDITSATYSTTSFDLSSQMALAHSLRFGDNGTKFYVVDATTATIYQYEAT